jgi:hypothetical protein
MERPVSRCQSPISTAVSAVGEQPAHEQQRKNRDEDKRHEVQQEGEQPTAEHPAAIA